MLPGSVYCQYPLWVGLLEEGTLDISLLHPSPVFLARICEGIGPS